MTVNFKGDISEYAGCIAALTTELGLETSENAGFTVTVSAGEGLSVNIKNGAAEIVCGSRILFCRALSHLAAHINEPVFSISEKPRFDLGIHYDLSRDAVLNIDTMKFFLRKMALMGIRIGILYMEDTYEIEGEPYFGYMRGRYSAEELREMDDYAYSLGIELIAHIQTLGHLNHLLKWPAYSGIMNTADVLLIDEDATYDFIEKMMLAATSPLRSKRVHLGLDEANSMIDGVYRQKHGVVNISEVMGRHVRRVMDIAKKHGLSPMIYSDMFFRHAFGTNYPLGEDKNFTNDIIATVPRDAKIVYWDYYHEDEPFYDNMFRLHAQLSDNVCFYGGIYGWQGFVIDYVKTLNATLPALRSCLRHGISEVIAALWGDDGAESNYLGALYGMQLYAEFCYSGTYDQPALDTRFFECVGADAYMFLRMTDIDYLNGDEVGPEVRIATGSSKRTKNIMYEDPLMPLFEDDLEEFDLIEHFEVFEKEFRGYAEECPEFRLLFEYAAALGRACYLHAQWRIAAPAAVRAGNREGARRLISLAIDAANAADDFRRAFRKLWDKTNKPFGFEVHDVRIGGVVARFRTAAEKLKAFADGEIDDIPELSSEKLPFGRRVPGAPKGLVRKLKWHDMASVCTMVGAFCLRN